MPKKRGTKRPARPNTTFNEKGALSLLSSGNARLNYFFKAVRGLEPQFHIKLLEAAWKEDPLDTLKLIFQTRDCRGGKGEKQLFRDAIKWLAETHPEVLTKNFGHIPFYGTWKDVLSVLNTPLEEVGLEHYAEQLKKDLQIVSDNANKEGKKPQISLAVKWAPTENHKDDKNTKVAHKLALRLAINPKTSLRDYRKQYLVPLRSYLRVTEVLMCAKDWDKIGYSGVPSRCMHLNKKAFIKHDKERFEKFLGDVKSGKTTIKGGQLFPHELATKYMEGAALDDVIELQWKVIIDKVLEAGKLKDSIVLSDVSGSMSGTPMQVSIALGILISSVTLPPFKDNVITFHENPTFFTLKGTTLKDRVTELQAAPWGGTTNFQKVFDMILERATQFKLPAAAMPKRLFVISDMQFDVADRNYATNFETIKRKYSEANYTMPQIVFWNVRANTTDCPVSADERGTALISGFSPSILKDLVDAGDLPDPYSIMRKVLDGERYSILKL